MTRRSRPVGVTVICCVAAVGYGLGGVVAISQSDMTPGSRVPWAAVVYLPMAIAAALTLLQSNVARWFFLLYWPLTQLLYVGWSLHHGLAGHPFRWQSSLLNPAAYLLCAVVLLSPAARRYFRRRGRHRRRHHREAQPLV